MANLCPGDIILAINGENTDNMTHLEAQNKIKACVDQLLLSVNRLVLSDVLLCQFCSGGFWLALEQMCSQAGFLEHPHGLGNCPVFSKTVKQNDF